MTYIRNDLTARISGGGQLQEACSIEDLRWQMPERSTESPSDFVRELETLVQSLIFGSLHDTFEFLLGTIGHCAPNLPCLRGEEQDVELFSTDRRRRDRKGRAALTCAIVDGVWADWGSRAHALFHPLVGKLYMDG